MSTTEPTFDDPDIAGTTATTPAPGDLVTYTQDTPWGEQTLVGRVVASGIPAGGTDPMAYLEWITVTGPIDATTLVPYAPAV